MGKGFTKPRKDSPGMERAVFRAPGTQALFRGQPTGGSKTLGIKAIPGSQIGVSSVLIASWGTQSTEDFQTSKSFGKW